MISSSSPKSGRASSKSPGLECLFAGQPLLLKTSNASPAIFARKIPLPLETSPRLFLMRLFAFSEVPLPVCHQNSVVCHRSGRPRAPRERGWGHVRSVTDLVPLPTRFLSRHLLSKPGSGRVVADPEITPVLPFWSYFWIDGHPFERSSINRSARQSRQTVRNKFTAMRWFLR